jgi:3-polyprenyl-4-hydroxybenzoate decarboxylase
MPVGERRLVQAPVARVMDGGDAIWVLGPGRDGALLQGDAAGVVRAVLEASREPSTRVQLVERVVAAGGGDAGAAAVVSAAVDLLVRMGALVDAAEREAPAVAASTGRVLVGVTGAIAVIQAPVLVKALLAAGHDVRVAMTRSARRFLAPRLFQALTHRRVGTGMWAGTPGTPAPHVEAARWADVVVVDPCSATTLSRIVAGDCSDLVAAIVTTTRAPVLLVPSMNREMLGSAAAQANLAAAVERGCFVARAGGAIEVADAPGERALTGGGAAPPANVARFVSLLLERAAADAPRLPTPAEWDEEHAGWRGDPDALDPEIAALLDELAPAPVLLLEVGTGLGAVARASARRGHTVVATDSSLRAIERAARVAPELPVAWLVDDATDSSLRGTFDVCVDRGCLGCIPAARRQRYVAQIAAWLRPGGTWIAKVHRTAPSQVRAHGFEPPDMATLAGSLFEIVRQTRSTLTFGAAGERPAWTVVLRRAGHVAIRPPRA